MTKTDRHVAEAAEDHAVKPSFPAAIGFSQRTGQRSASSPHAHKFRAAFALLAGFGLGAVVVAVVLAVSGGGGPAPAWSQWRPPDKGIAGAQDIAEHLAPLYRISGVDQLDVVTVVNLSNANAVNPLTGAPEGLQVAVRASATSSAVSLLPGNTVAYNMCGVSSPDCAIKVGTPSTLRELLLRREALELALYTFKYVPGVSNVVAILPPGYETVGCNGQALCPTPHGSSKQVPQTTAVLFLHTELQPWLSQPLANTFPEQYPPDVQQLSLWSQTTEAALVDQLTAPGLFSAQLVHAQDGSTLVDLNPQPPS